MIKPRKCAMNKQLKVVFWGSDEFSILPFLRAVENFNVVAFVCETDKPVGRKQQIMPSKMKVISDEKNILCLQPEIIKNNAEFIKQLRVLQPDICLLAAYGKIIPKQVLEIPSFGFINIHPSLLPKYRGACPVQSALLNGDKVTGVTIIKMEEALDSGDILAQKEAAIESDDDYLSLGAKLSSLGANLVVRACEDLAQNKVVLVKQDATKATFCRKIKKQDALIDWNSSNVEIDNKIRAYAKWPTAFTFFKKKKISILKARAIGFNDKKTASGTVLINNGKVLVNCAEGSLELIQVQIESKKAMDIRSFVNGSRDFVGAVLG